MWSIKRKPKFYQELNGPIFFVSNDKYVLSKNILPL